MAKPRSTTTKTMSLFWRYAWQYPRYLVSLFVAVPLTVLIYQFLPPLILADVLSRLAKGSFQPRHIWASFGPSLVLYAAFMFIGGTLGWRVVNYFDWKIEAAVERRLAQHIFQHVLSQSANFHANRFSGSMVSQTNKLLSSYVRFKDTTLYQVIPLVSSLVFVVVILAGRTPLFAVILLVFAFLYILSSFFVTRHVRNLSAQQAAVESEQTGYLADAVTNVMAVKSFAGMKFENAGFAQVTDRSYNLTLRGMRAFAKQQTYFSTLTSSILSLSLVMAVIGVMVFKSDLATVFLIFNYTANITQQLWNFSSSSLRNYNRSFGDAADMVEILEIEPEVKDPPQPEKSRIRDGAIEFRGVDFTHEGAGGALFHKLNLQIKAGEKVGLVGHSGSGKTTFTRLLLRFSDIDGGEILIDGQNIAHLTQDDLRREIAYVPQEPIMFHRGLMENIRYGQLDASDEAVIAAAKLAHADDFIKQLPKGYDTLVGERGVKLSGGQRQRVAIARALLKNAPILLLDEATSALDSESEKLIQAALWKLMEGRTAIVIAHRLSTIQKMDRIVVLDDGQIVEQGSHQELLKTGGSYASLWKHQSGGFLDD